MRLMKLSIGGKKALLRLLRIVKFVAVNFIEKILL